MHHPHRLSHSLLRGSLIIIKAKELTNMTVFLAVVAAVAELTFEIMACVLVLVAHFITTHALFAIEVAVVSIIPRAVVAFLVAPIGTIPSVMMIRMILVMMIRMIWVMMIRMIGMCNLINPMAITS